MADNELFRTTLMGGYDKDDVERHIQKMQDEAYVNKNRLLQRLKQKEQIIQELSARLDEKDDQLRQKERDIKEKYQAYIDNYEQIGRLVYESRVRADRMIIDAREESRRIIQEARNLAKRRLDQVQAQIDDKLDEGRLKHQAIQKELDVLLELLKEVRKQCMQSYDNVEYLVGSYTEQEDPFAGIMAELEERTGIPETPIAEEATFQEQISFMKSQLSQESQPMEELFDEEDAPEELESMNNARHIMEDEDELDDPDGAFPEIKVLSVEEVLKSIDEQQAAVAAAKAAEETSAAEADEEAEVDDGEAAGEHAKAYTEDLLEADIDEEPQA